MVNFTIKDIGPTVFHDFNPELTKINTFYSEKLAEATRKFATLKSELASTQEPPHKSEVRFVSRLLPESVSYSRSFVKLLGSVRQLNGSHRT